MYFEIRRLRFLKGYTIRWKTTTKMTREIFFHCNCLDFWVFGYAIQSVRNVSKKKKEQFWRKSFLSIRKWTNNAGCITQRNTDPDVINSICKQKIKLNKFQWIATHISLKNTTTDTVQCRVFWLDGFGFFVLVSIFFSLYFLSFSIIFLRCWFFFLS